MKSQHLSFSEYADRLHEAGYRMTASRAAIAHVLSEADLWLNPEEILQRGKERCPSLGLVTVYRTLALFDELGLVRRIHAHPGCHGYVSATLEHSHHLVCSGCQQVVEFPGSETLAPFIHEIEQQTGFVVDDHMLELHGLCPACQEQTAPVSRTTTASRTAKEFTS